MIESEQLQAYKDSLREGMVNYTRRAFRRLPELAKPCILDVGCGSGIPTMELARLSDGQIIGLDIDQALLARLVGRIERAGLSHRVKTIRGSLFDMDFPDESFDIIWAEGSISVIGFARGIKEWRRLLKRSGFLVVHDELGDMVTKLEQVSQCGYELTDHFVLGGDVWWGEYYAPLEVRLNEIRAEFGDDTRVSVLLGDDQREIEAFKQDPERYRSVFLIMKKVNGNVP